MPTRDVMAVILGGGRGTRLYPLTKLRAKPAVPIGGKYRLIDIPISNCLNSDIHKIYVLTQFLSASLHRHIYQTYKFDIFTGGFVYILAAEESPSGMDWYQGTADAVRKQLPRFAHTRVEDILILSGDHLYRMDYGEFVETHREKRADVTIAVQPVASADASRFGILKTDEDDRIVSFHEKPAPDEFEGLESISNSDRPYLASMGIYIFRPDVLQEVLEGSDAEDFGKQIIPAAIEQLRVYAFPFHGYWEDIGTIRAFYEANLALTLPQPPFDFYDPQCPIYTRPRFLPYSSTDGCDLVRTVLAEGCVIHQSDIREAVIGMRSIIGPGVRIARTVMLGADFYETPERKKENRSLGRPDVGIGRGSSIEGAIIDKNARIGEGVIIRPHEPDDEMIETDNYVIRDGVVVVPKNAVLPDGTVI
ncbi:MAG: glucose-1-phosphate adenylyltransferase [Chloroflexi bacterium]|nr:MAG: glucose-1-phosphate adenylyltransferase [Chloroflexota bacterium]